MRTKRYGWLPDLPDRRDLLYAPPPHVLRALPPKVDLRDRDVPIYDQSNLGSCTANAVAGAVQFERAKQGLPNFVPSRLFIYYGERVLENTVASDSGAQIRDGIKVMASSGAPPEDLWPYDVSQFAVRPPTAAYQAAKLDAAVRYQRLLRTSDLAALMSCLAEGYPFAFGFSVYSSFESDAVAHSGLMPMPEPDEQLLGGHAVEAIGYEQVASVLYFTVRNSWGTGWGEKGYFYMPAGVLRTPALSDDFWQISLIGQG